MIIYNILKLEKNIIIIYNILFFKYNIKILLNFIYKISILWIFNNFIIIDVRELDELVPLEAPSPFANFFISKFYLNFFEFDRKLPTDSR